jgi:hypothetical protein
VPITTADPEAAFKMRVAKNQMTDNDRVDLVKAASANKSITYAHLKKNADKYVGKPWRLYGRILEIEEGHGKTAGRISLSDYADSVLYFEYAGETDFVQNNLVELVGLLAGNYTYTSQAGWNISIPAIAAGAIVKHGALDKIAGIKARHSEED